MRVFLSWSGPRSKAIAFTLKEWLPLCIQELDPWMSAEDTQKGALWYDEIEAALSSADGQAIFCVTPENLESTWLNFEAGFVASKGSKARVCALLLGIDDPSIVRPPIGLFQLTLATKGEVFKLLKTLNAQLERQVPERVLFKAFEANWGELELEIQRVLALSAAPAVREPSEPEKLGELVSIARRIEQAVADHSVQLGLLRDVAVRSVVREADTLFGTPSATSHSSQKGPPALTFAELARRGVSGDSWTAAKDLERRKSFLQAPPDRSNPLEGSGGKEGL